MTSMQVTTTDEFLVRHIRALKLGEHTIGELLDEAISLDESSIASLDKIEEITDKLMDAGILFITDDVPHAIVAFPKHLISMSKELATHEEQLDDLVLSLDAIADDVQAQHNEFLESKVLALKLGEHTISELIDEVKALIVAGESASTARKNEITAALHDSGIVLHAMHVEDWGLDVYGLVSRAGALINRDKELEQYEAQLSSLILRLDAQ